MEVFRPLDGLATAIADATPPLDQWRKFVYCESLTRRVFGEVDHFKVRHSPFVGLLSALHLIHYLLCMQRGHATVCPV